MARANPDRQKDLAKKLEQGKFSIRDWREQLSNIMGMCVFFDAYFSHSSVRCPIDRGMVTQGEWMRIS